jgi:8-oxo-dGTP pyrophosphatase MutT (NUDIX family)
MAKDPDIPDRKDWPKPALRPRDAATLILYRQNGRAIEVLMGERHGGHAFMPNRYVFPGGRVDPDDWKVRDAGALKPHVAARLAKACPPSRARALAAAAIRETFEETGLIIGKPDPMPDRPVPEGWKHFFATGHAPALDVLDYVLRAVTPPYRPRRFNARFFIADATHAQGQIKGSGELLDLRWLPVEDALKLELPRITEIVLERLAEIVQRYPGQDHPVALFRYLRGQHLVEQE